MEITEHAPIEVSVYRSKIDGALVVEIDTTDETGDLRINLNDGQIWTGDPESTTSGLALLKRIEELVPNALGYTDEQDFENLRRFRGEVSAMLYPLDLSEVDR